MKLNCPAGPRCHVRLVLTLALCLAWLAAVLAPAPAASAQPPPSLLTAPGPHAVTELRLDWRDAARERELPVKLHLPSGAGPWPLVVFSHGLGGSREGYAYLARHWASHGLACLHLQHLGSDDSLWRLAPNPVENLARALTDIAAALDRPRDASFALDEVVRQQKAGAAWAMAIDPARTGAAGHSFGGFTALALAGQSFARPTGGRVSLADPRFRAFIAISVPVDRAREDPVPAFAPIRKPVLHITGAFDTSFFSQTTPADRRLAFAHAGGGDQYFLNLSAADHRVFAGPRAQGPLPGDQAIQEMVAGLGLTFWRAYLLDDAAARTWLMGPAAAAWLGAAGAWERRAGD